MIRTVIRGLAAGAATAILLGGSAGSVAAADDYTLPFYEPAVTLAYGVDRDPRVGVQLDYTGKTWWDGVPHPGRVYDNHTGLDYPMPLRSPVAAAKDGTVLDSEGGFGTQQWGNFGNFVLVRHPDGRRTLYYHLASAADGGISVGIGEAVVDGDQVGRSGCSGLCTGPHLHFEMLVEQGLLLLTTDPMFQRLWTTWPGRVPFLAAYVRESNPGTEVVRRWQTITHWVEFRNTGGRAWKPSGMPGRILLATWNPPTHASPFRAADWPTATVATLLDQATVTPDQVGRFTFGIRGSPPVGSYTETFNLLADSVRWFDHAALGGFYVPIVVTDLVK
jgi:murein DD-endopeptidase MepM/ murein hydrolase activator NlpD